MSAATLCAALLAVTSPDISTQAPTVCPAVVDAAEAHHLRPSLLLSIAWHESRLRMDVVHPESGAAGPLQVMPALQTDAGLVDDGARILRTWLDHEAQQCTELPTVADVAQALCRYACGYRCSAPCRWSRTRLRLAERIELATLASY
jgi:hypothetical protein